MRSAPVAKSSAPGGDSNSRPSGFRRRRTLSSFALAHPLRQDTFQFLAALSRLQILFPSHRFCARRIFLLMRQCPQSSVFRGFCDAAIVLAYALSKMRRESRIEPACDRVLENVYGEHGASCGAPGGIRTPDLLVSAGGGLYPAELSC